MKKLFIILGMMSLLFATPTIKVSLTDVGGNYKGNIEMSFVCDYQKIPFSCREGVCTNKVWFDSSSRCYDQTDGFLEFKTEKNPSIVNSDIFYLYDEYDSRSKNSYEYYELNLGLDGNINSQYNSSGCCAGTILLVLVGFGVYRKLNY